MQPDVFHLIGYGSLALLIVYITFFIKRARAAPKAQARSREASEVHTLALRENSELLRELIAVNRQLLEKQERSDA